MSLLFQRFHPTQSQVTEQRKLPALEESSLRGAVPAEGDSVKPNFEMLKEAEAERKIPEVSHNHGSVENYLKWKVVDPFGDTTVISPWLWFRKGFLTLQVLALNWERPHIICIILHAGSKHLRFEGQQCSNRSWSTISKFDSQQMIPFHHQFPEIKSFLVEFPCWTTFWGKVQWHYQNWKIPSTRMIAILKEKTRDPLVNILSFLLGILFWLTHTKFWGPSSKAQKFARKSKPVLNSFKFTKNWCLAKAGAVISSIQKNFVPCFCKWNLSDVMADNIPSLRKWKILPILPESFESF